MPPGRCLLPFSSSSSFTSTLKYSSQLPAKFHSQLFFPSSIYQPQFTEKKTTNFSSAAAVTPSSRDSRKNRRKFSTSVDKAHRAGLAQEDTVKKGFGPGRPGRPVICVETGVEYASLTAAAKELGVYGKQSIHKAIRLGHKSGGFHWQYKEARRPGNEYVSMTREGNCVRVSVNRPSLHNAFNEVVIRELSCIFQELAKDPALRSVVLTGEGKSFSAGADLNWMKRMVEYSKQENEEDSRALFDLFFALRQCPVPVIARVNGAAFGGGCGLVAACDIAYALRPAKFAFTEVKLGLIPAVISPFVMEKIGVSNCTRYFLTGEVFSAEQAQRIGLIQEVVEDEAALDAMVANTVAALQANSPQAVRRAKQIVRRVSQMPVEQSRQYVTCEIASLRVSVEGQEGLKAFLEKRAPAWKADNR